MKSFKEFTQMDESGLSDMFAVLKHNQEMKLRPEYRYHGKIIPDDKVPKGYTKHPETGHIEQTGTTQRDDDEAEMKSRALHQAAEFERTKNMPRKGSPESATKKYYGRHSGL